MNTVTLPDTHTDPSRRNAVDITAFEATLEREAAVSHTVTQTNGNCSCNSNEIYHVPLRSVPLASSEKNQLLKKRLRQSCMNHAPSDVETESEPETENEYENETRATPTFTDLLSALTSKLPQPQPPSSPPHVEVELMIYDARSGTATARISASSTAPLTLLFDAIPCTTISTSSALLYVNNVFYEHTHPSCSDYSTSIAKFISAHRKTSLPPPKIFRFTTSNNAPKVRALRPKLGQPYVYIHDKDCEHRVIFTDVRSARTNAAERGQVRILSSWGPRVQPCDVCFVKAANIAVFSDKIAPCSPFHYCNRCCERAHPDSYERAQLTSVEHPKLVPDEEERRLN